MEHPVEHHLEASRLKYVTSLQRVASSLELIAFENAHDLGPDDTSELIEIVTRLQNFIERCALKAGLSSMAAARIH